MHRSRVSTFLIDVKRDEVPDATAFWSKALGVRTSSPQGEPGGHLLCVIPVHSEPAYFEQHATVWSGE